MNHKPSGDPDWRIASCAHLHGQSFKQKKWHPPIDNPAWDHDHCSACSKKIWDKTGRVDDRSVQEGYASLATDERPDDYDWVCVECFSDLADSQDWSIAGNAQ